MTKTTDVATEAHIAVERLLTEERERIAQAIEGRIVAADAPWTDYTHGSVDALRAAARIARGEQ